MNIKDEYSRRGKNRIPGLTQLLSKRPDQFAPGVWPTYFSKASGTNIWDLDGNCYIDMSISGIGATILGYCDKDVDQAVIDAIKNCNSSSLNCIEEIELAELLCDIHPWAEKVRYARTGGEAMAVAVRIARAATGRDRVAFCGYHGWHDWYLAANLSEEDSLSDHLLPRLSTAGVPKGLKGSSIPFKYNQIEQLESILDKYSNEIAAIILEPIRNEQPLPGFLEKVRSLASSTGAVLIFDEISSGFRLNSGGAHQVFGIEPDIAVFAKAISNGYPMAAIIGRSDVMQAVEKTFISSTYWTDRIGPAAAIATINKHRQENVSQHLIDIGKSIQKIWLEVSRDIGLKVKVFGIFPMSHLEFEGEDAQLKMTLFVQEMLKQGFLVSNRFYANYSHSKEHLMKYAISFRLVLNKIKSMEDLGSLNSLLECEIATPGFHRYN